MDCCQCQGIETQFNEKEAQNKLKAYRKNGPARTTRMLVEALKGELATARRSANGSEGITLLDIGGGVGAIQHEMLKAGVERATGVDASAAYAKAAQEEAERQGHEDRVSYYHANFVDIAPQIPPADIVTLDRVICCYHDMPSLVGLSVAKAGMLYGLVYPRDTWLLRAGIRTGNLFLRLARNPFRGYVHPTRAVDTLVRNNGLQRRFYKTTALWQVVVYARPSGSAFADK
jgi:predicted TPR repeat methyltransferase